MPTKRSTSPMSALLQYVSDRVGPPEANGCRLWVGPRFKDGRGRSRSAHSIDPSEIAARVVYAMVKGPIPVGLKVCHSCDNAPAGCVEITHLFLGTQADNMADMAAKSRNRRGDGRHFNARFTNDQVRDIKVSYATGQRVADIARVWNVNASTISRIVHGLRWTHIR